MLIAQPPREAPSLSRLHRRQVQQRAQSRKHPRKRDQQINVELRPLSGRRGAVFVKLLNVLFQGSEARYGVGPLDSAVRRKAR